MSKQISTGAGIAAVVAAATIIILAVWLTQTPQIQAPTQIASAPVAVQHSNSTNQTNSSNKSTSSVNSSVTNEEISYENKEYGFKVVLPQEWKWFRAEVAKNQGEDEFKNLTLVIFKMPTKDKRYFEGKDNYAGFAFIEIYETAVWDKIFNSAKCQGENATPDCVSKEFVLARNDKYVFSWRLAQDNPSDLDKLRNSAESALKTGFRLIKQ